MKKFLMALVAGAAIGFMVPAITDAAPRQCMFCGGKGYTEKRIVTPNYSGDPNHHDTWVKEECWRCHGTGQLDI